MAIRVTCTQCGAAYKIDETKIPATGGAVKCQACGMRFAVMLPRAAESEPKPAEQQTPIGPPPKAPRPQPMADEQTPVRPVYSPPIRKPGASQNVPGETNPRIPMPAPTTISASIALPSLSEGTNPGVNVPRFGGESTSPGAKAPTRPPTALPSFGSEPTKAGVKPPDAIALPRFGSEVTSVKAPPASEVIPLPSFSENTSPGLKARPHDEVTRPVLAPKAESTTAMPAGPIHDDTPINVGKGGGLFSDEKKPVSAPLVLPPSPPIPQPVLNVPDVIAGDDDIIEDINDGRTQVSAKVPTFDDLPAPAGAKVQAFAPPDDLPAPEGVAPQFTDTTLANAPPSARPPDDLPGLARSHNAPRSLGPAIFAPTMMEDTPPKVAEDDMPNPLASAPSDLPSLFRPTPDDLPSPLGAVEGAHGVSFGEGLPEPVDVVSFRTDDDLPTPLEAESGTSDDTPSARGGQVPAAGTLDDEIDAVRNGQRSKLRGRIAMMTAVVVLTIVGGGIASYFVTGEMPWALLDPPPPPVAQVQQAPAVVPPAPDFATIEGKNLDAYLKALAVLDERQVARKKRNEPDKEREDRALRARIVWHGAVILGSRTLAAELKKLPAPKEGSEPHPHEERAEAARALVEGDRKAMAERLNKLLARDKGDKDAHLLYGYALLQAEDTAAASKHFEEVLRIDEVDKTGAKSIDALLGQAEIARRTGDLDSAAGFLEKAEEAHKGNLRVRLLRAELDHENGARDAVDKAIKSMIGDAESFGERDRATLRFLHATYAAYAANVRVATSELNAAWADDPSPKIARALVWSKLARGEVDGVPAILETARSLDDGTYAESFFLAELTTIVADKNFAKAKVTVATAAKAGVDKRSTLYADGMSLEAQKKLALAMKAYAASAKADKFFSLPLLANIRLKKPKMKLVRLALAAKSIGDARTLAAYGDALYDEASYEQAAERLQAALDKDPWLVDLPHVAERLADAYQKAGNAAAGARIAIENAAVDPKDAASVLKLFAMAKTAQAYEEAQRVIEAGLEEQPKSIDLLLALAEVQILRDNRDNARAVLQKVLKADDKNAYAHELLARSYSPKEPDLVKLHIKNAIEIAPKVAAYHALLGEAYFAKEKYDEAHDAFERAIALDAKNVDALLMQARIADVQGRKKEAIDSYKMALALAPERKQTIAELAERLEDIGQKREALEMLTAAFKRDPQDRALAIGIGRIHQSNGNRALAIKFFKQASKIDPNDAAAYFRLGYLYKDVGNNKEAKKAFETYLKINPKADDRKDIEVEIAELR